jgi:hypothetical protein
MDAHFAVSFQSPHLRRSSMRRMARSDHQRQEGIGVALTFEQGNTGSSLVAMMLTAAKEMGRLEERMWWRAGIDAATGDRREALALTGRKVKRGLKDGAAVRNKAHALAREARFARMAVLVPSLGVENAARQCEAEGLGGWQAIRRQWDRFKENPDR